MTYLFSARSRNNLNTCHPFLIAIAEKVMSWQVMDFTVIEGHRTPERQQELYHRGASKIDGIERLSMHNHSPSLAVDICPYPIDWNDKFRFHVLAGLMFAAAKELGHELRWGGDWDGDWSNKDQTFHDLPHFELVLKE